MLKPINNNVLAALALSAVAALPAACDSRSDGTQQHSSAASPATTAPAGQVTIDNFTFSPQVLTVPVGTKVTWVNKDDVPHTVTSTTKPRAFASSALDTDERFSHVFTTPGTYAYFCTIHPRMTGQIIVK